MLSVIYAECHIQVIYDNWHYAKCRYAECHGAHQDSLIFGPKLNLAKWSSLQCPTLPVSSRASLQVLY
jgi:hypothetical protein